MLLDGVVWRKMYTSAKELTEATNKVNIMREFTTQLLTDETKNKVINYDNVVLFANEEEVIYLEAMTRAKDDMVRRASLVDSFNKSVISFARNYAN